MVSKRVVRHTVDEKLGTIAEGQSAREQTSGRHQAYSSTEPATSLQYPEENLQDTVRCRRPASFTEPSRVYNLEVNELEPGSPSLTIREPHIPMNTYYTTGNTNQRRGDVVSPKFTNSNHQNRF